MSDRTVAFEYDNDFWYLHLHDRPYSDEELRQEALLAIGNLVRGRHVKDGWNEDQILAEARTIPWQVVDSSTLPPDRYFRGALRAEKGRFTIDMPKAREIHMNRIRKARDKALTALDVETMKAVGKGDQQSLTVTEARKNFLRNIPQTLDLSKAKTPEELRAIWPPRTRMKRPRQERTIHTISTKESRKANKPGKKKKTKSKKKSKGK